MKKESISITILTSDVNNTRLLLEGQLTIRNATAIKKELISALNNSQTIDLIFRNVIKIDLAVLQLLVALQKSTARLEKKVFLDMELTDYMNSVMQNSGFEKIIITNSKCHVNGIY